MAVFRIRTIGYRRNGSFKDRNDRISGKMIGKIGIDVAETWDSWDLNRPKTWNEWDRFDSNSNIGWVGWVLENVSIQ